VYASVGPSRARQADLTAEHGRKSRFETPLDRLTARLDLEPGERTAVVRDDQRYDTVWPWRHGAIVAVTTQSCADMRASRRRVRPSPPR
jgi:hypothetical protein